jgi:hypothetical protein
MEHHAEGGGFISNGGDAEASEVGIMATSS